MNSFLHIQNMKSLNTSLSYGKELTTGKKSICTCNSYYHHKEYRALKDSKMNL